MHVMRRIEPLLPFKLLSANRCRGLLERLVVRGCGPASLLRGRVEVIVNRASLIEPLFPLKVPSHFNRLILCRSLPNGLCKAKRVVERKLVDKIMWCERGRRSISYLLRLSIQVEVHLVRGVEALRIDERSEPRKG